MSVIHIAEDEIAEKLPGLLTRVKAGDEIVIDHFCSANES